MGKRGCEVPLFCFIPSFIYTDAFTDTYIYDTTAHLAAPHVCPHGIRLTLQYHQRQTRHPPPHRGVRGGKLLLRAQRLHHRLQLRRALCFGHHQQTHLLGGACSPHISPTHRDAHGGRPPRHLQSEQRLGQVARTLRAQPHTLPSLHTLGRLLLLLQQPLVEPLLRAMLLPPLPPPRPSAAPPTHIGEALCPERRSRRSRHVPHARGLEQEHLVCQSPSPLPRLSARHVDLSGCLSGATHAAQPQPSHMVRVRSRGPVRTLLHPIGACAPGLPLLLLLLATYSMGHLHLLPATWPTITAPLVPPTGMGRRDKLRLLPHPSAAATPLCRGRALPAPLALPLHRCRRPTAPHPAPQRTIIPLL